MVKLRVLWFIFIMTRTWDLPLSASPHLLMMGIGVHRPQRGWDRYCLPGLWCLHFYRYDGELKINGESFPIRPGHCSVTPPGALLEYSYGHTPSVHAVAHFRLEGESETLVLPAMRDLGDAFSELSSLFEEAIPWLRTEPARASARVWDVLWRLGKLPGDQEASTPLRIQSKAIERAQHYIEVHLNAPLKVARVAEYSGFSHNHFTRVFAAATGSTPAQYIRARRVERARHLLEHSTLPIKAITSQCGLGDLQAFNKTLRRELGKSPRELRK
jgi:AraC-like DNA-binding protein